MPSSMQYVWRLSRNVSQIIQIRDISALKELARAVGIDNYLSDVWKTCLPSYLQYDLLRSSTTILYYCTAVVTTTTTATATTAATAAATTTTANTITTTTTTASVP